MKIMSINQPSPEIQKKIAEFTQLENQLRTVKIQIDASQRQTAESNQTLKELRSIDESTEIYKMSGGVLFKTPLEKVKSDLEDTVEYLEIQFKKLKQKETELASAYNKLGQELTSTLK